MAAPLLAPPPVDTPVNSGGQPSPTWARWLQQLWDSVRESRASVVWDPGSLLDAAGETSAAITVKGATFGDAVLVGAPYDLQGIVCTGYVSADNTVRVRLQNESGATVDLASGTWKVRVIGIP